MNSKAASVVAATYFMPSLKRKVQPTCVQCAVEAQEAVGTVPFIFQCVRRYSSCQSSIIVNAFYLYHFKNAIYIYIRKRLRTPRCRFLLFRYTK